MRRPVSWPWRRRPASCGARATPACRTTTARCPSAAGSTRCRTPRPRSRRRNAAADQYGGDRTAAEDAFTSAVVALDMHTGNTRWHVNTVHHDLWDYDLGAQPLVTDIDVDGTPRRVVVQGTKTGSVFVLDARTGEAVKPVQERPVPAGTLPGERYAPTQPQSVGMPNFAGMPGPEPEVLTEANSFGLTPIDAALCRIAFR